MRLPTLPVVLAGVAAFLDLYSTQPLLPLFTRTFGASTFEAGLTITAPTVAVAIFAPIVGRLADRLRPPRVLVRSPRVVAPAPAPPAAPPTPPPVIAWRVFPGGATPA